MGAIAVKAASKTFYRKQGGINNFCSHSAGVKSRHKRLQPVFGRGRPFFPCGRHSGAFKWPKKKKSIINSWPFESGCSLPPFPKLTLLTFGNMCFVWWQNTALESGVLSQSLVWEQSQSSRQLLSLQEQMGWIIFWRAVRSKTEEDAVQLTEVQNC